MLSKITKAALSHSFIFASLDDSLLQEILNSVAISTAIYEKGQTICSPNSFERRIGIVVSGCCEVWQKRADDGYVLINSLLSSQSFGVLSVLSKADRFPTHIVASKKSEIAYISADSMMLLIEMYPQIAKNIIAFLAERITFLNSKISTFSSGSVEEKLAKFLAIQMNATNSTTINISKSLLAKRLGAGRASLYRAIRSLESKNIISVDTNNIVILNAEMLERILK